MRRRLFRRFSACGSPGTRKPKKRGPFHFVPVISLRNGREARIGLFSPKEAVGHHGDGVALALVFADQHSAGLETSVQFAGLLAPGQSVQELHRFPVEAAKGFLLDSVSNHPANDVLGQALRRNGAERHAPALCEARRCRGTESGRPRPRSQRGLRSADPSLGRLTVG